MAQNKLSDLNNHLFAQLERLSDEDLSQEDLSKEINRSKAINTIARNIIDNAKTTLEGVKVSHDYKPGNEAMPEVFEPKKLT